MKKLVVLLAVAAACGPKPKPAPVPMLPGDGAANVAKPTAPSKSRANDPWLGRTDLIVPPAPKPPSKLDLPAIDELKLRNGLQVYVIKSSRLPVVSVQLAIKAGRMHEPRARLGVAEATADMLVKGTKRHDAIAIANTIEAVGGTLATNTTYEATLLTCSVLSRNLSTCLQLLPEMLTQSTFPDDELRKLKNMMIAQVRQRLENAGLLASAHVQNLLWGDDHPRGWSNSEATINALRRDDLIAWHDAWYVPNNAILVVSGDVDTKKLKRDLERAFHGWKKGAVPPAPSHKAPGLSGSRIRLVDKPGQTQTHIRVAQFGIAHDDPRFFDTLVWNYALGGGAFSSRLMKVVRVDGGKAYGASSTFDHNLDRGSFVAATFTRNAEAVATTKLLLGEIAKMAQDGPTQAEVDAAIANIAGGYGMRFQSVADIGNALMAAELHGFGTNYLTNFPVVVGKVDVESAKRAAGEILDPNNYVIVMVGDAKDLEPQLQKAGWRYEKVSYAEPITKAVARPERPPDPKEVAAARRLVAQALVAKGGKAKLAAIKSLREVATGTTKIQGQQLPVQIERIFVVPDKMRIDATLANKFKVIVGVDGKTGWQQAPTQNGGTQTVEFKGKDIEQAQFEAWREPELILLKAADPKAKLRPAPDDTIDGRPHAAVRLASPYGPDVTLYIDKKTKLVSRLTFQDKGVMQIEEFSDYKDVKGIKVAHKRSSSGQGRVTKLEITKVEWDPKIDPAIFKKPAK